MQRRSVRERGEICTQTDDRRNKENIAGPTRLPIQSSLERLQCIHALSLRVERLAFLEGGCALRQETGHAESSQKA